MTPPPAARYLDLLAHLEQTRAAGVALGLERTRAVLERLGNPQRRAVTIQIAGTNGKGSTAAMAEAILRARGLRTGLYTSPHLLRFTERIRVDGREADGDQLAALAPRIAATGIPLTYFETATVLAFLLFAARGVEVIVAETGLGGRLDATTACEPVATAISSIALDHADLLGETLGEIAAEKAGIAKSGVPLYVAAVPPEAEAVIARVAGAVGAPLYRLGRDFVLADQVSVGLEGQHQRSNAALAVALARVAASAAGRPLRPADIQAGLTGVVWPGRLEWIGAGVLLDCAHNAEGAAALCGALERLPERRPRALVFSAVAGKPVEAMLSLLVPRFDAVFLAVSSNPRALPVAALTKLMPARAPATVRHMDDAVGALRAALALVGAAPGQVQTAAGDAARSSRSGLVVGAGSTFLIGDLRAELLGEGRDPIATSDPVAPARGPAIGS